MGTFVWKTRKNSENDVNKLISKRKIPRPIALSLFARGITEANFDSFMSSRLQSLGDPFQLPGVEKAAARIWLSISRRENILIYGDYDTDGITAATVLYKVLSQNGANVSCFLPHRFENGYGFTVESLEKAIENTSYGLIITVDCGITGTDSATAAAARGIDVIITDHHEPGGELPEVFAMINPKLHKDMDDLSVLAGVGVAFKLCHGFLKYGRAHQLGGETTDLKTVLDLVALGTVADIVPLLGENRIMVRHGLKILESQIRPGIRALCESSNLDSKLRPSHISFNLAPKLNAAGRFGSPNEAFDLLNTDNIVTANSIADALCCYNNIRKEKENEIYHNALDQLNRQPDRRTETVFAAGKGWHLGVVGIVASRLARDFNSPAIVLSIDGGLASGSGRSIEGINLIELLNASSDLLIQYGGHPMAAGVSLKTENLGEFSVRFSESMAASGVKTKIPSMDIEADISLSELDDNFFHYLEQMEPFGHGNPEPLYRLNCLSPEYVAAAADKHSRGVLRDRKNTTMNFIAFNIDVRSLPSSGCWDVLASPKINDFRGEKNFQMELKDVRESEGFF